MARVISSKVINYNANVRGTRTGDCTARAISLAFNMDYSKARRALNEGAKTSGRIGTKYNSHSNCIRVIKNLGGGNLITPEEKITVGQFADTHSGTYILWCSADGKSGRTNHLVCVIDDRIYDSWNSTNYIVMGYWIVESGVKSADITNVGEYLQEWVNKDFEYWSSYAASVFDKIVDHSKKLKKLADEYGLDFDITLETKKVQLNGYTFTYWATIWLRIPGVKSDFKGIEVKFSIAFKPTQSVDQISEYFDKAFYIKFYDYIQNHLVSMLADFCEGNKFLSDLENTSGKPLPEEKSMRFWDMRSKRSFNTLPYWVKRLTDYFSIDNTTSWGEPAIEITLRIHVPPFDTEYGETTRETRRFEAESMDNLREQLEYYKKTGDYEKSIELQYNY